jgi:predicted metal-dependent hydrolase
MSTTLGHAAASRFWNETPFRSYLFNAFSILLPPGEEFVVHAVESALKSANGETAVVKAAEQFIDEERAHQRAHRLYNRQLASQGYNAVALENDVAHALQRLQQSLSDRERLALAAAFEYITALISQRALKRASWLTNEKSVQSTLWRWHCAEEVGHQHVTLDLMSSAKIGYTMRVLSYLSASAVLCFDIVRHISDFYRTDRNNGAVGRAAFWRSMFAFVSQNLGDMIGLSVQWCRYFLPLSSLSGAKDELRSGDIHVRFLKKSDVDALMVLERKKWNEEQTASESDLTQRIERYPHLCVGAFSARTGEVLASLFMKPIGTAEMRQAPNWESCARIGTQRQAKTNLLFGISLSSIQPAAVESILEFFWPHALKAGWRKIFLGSPVPGLREWKRKNPDVPVEKYVYDKRRGLPRDPQLRYYWEKGFKNIAACKEEYFPHEASLNYGVVICGDVPLSSLSFLWKRLPLSWLRGMRKILFLLL